MFLFIPMKLLHSIPEKFFSVSFAINILKTLQGYSGMKVFMNEKTSFECSSCNISFTFKTELNDHVFNVHGGKKPKVKKKNHHCEECNKSFLDTWKMQRHQKVHLKSKCQDQD